jgi:hypothetical protein
MSCEFRDMKDRTWRLEITAYSLKAVRATTGVDLDKLVAEDTRLLTELVSDSVKFVDVLFVLVKDQADRLSVTDEEFGRSLGGDAIEAAGRAFESAFLFFCPSRMRRVMAAARAKAEAALDLATAKAVANIEALDPESVFTNSASNSAASVESTPTPTVSATSR